MRNLLRVIMAASIATLLGSAIAACSEEADCSMTTRAMAQCNLYQRDAATGVVRRDTLPYTLTVTAIGTDSVIINREAQVKALSLPLRFTADTTQLVFHYEGGEEEQPVVDDTLTVIHTNTPYFISMDCGYQMKQVLTAVSHTTHLLDSVSIENPEATNYGKENIKLFYR